LSILFWELEVGMVYLKLLMLEAPSWTGPTDSVDNFALCKELHFILVPMQFNNQTNILYLEPLERVRKNIFNIYCRNRYLIFLCSVYSYFFYFFLFVIFEESASLFKSF
jgi:hypothetical protein